MKKLVFLMALIVTGLFLVQTVEAAWWNSSWEKRINITIPNSKIDTDLTNFPILINGSTVNSSVFSSSKSDLSDWRFTAADQSTELNHEIVIGDANNEEAEVWVKVNLSDGQDNIITLYYNNSGASEPSSAFQQNTWNGNYAGVWHYPDGSSLNADDSTSNSNTGSIQGATATTGQIDGGSTFDGNNDYIDSNYANTLTSSDAFSWSLWLKTASGGASNGDQIIQNFADANAEWGILVGYSTSGRLAWVAEDGGNWHEYQSSDTINDDNWRHVAVVFHGTGNNKAGTSTVTFYIDGQQSTTDIIREESGTWTGIGDSATWKIAQETSNFGSDDYFDGEMDEIRFIEGDSLITTNWISTEYNNQNFCIALGGMLCCLCCCISNLCLSCFAACLANTLGDAVCFVLVSSNCSLNNFLALFSGMLCFNLPCNCCLNA